MNQKDKLLEFFAKYDVNTPIYMTTFGLSQLEHKKTLEEKTNPFWTIFSPGMNFPVLILHKLRKVFGADDKISDVIKELENG